MKAIAETTLMYVLAIILAIIIIIIFILIFGPGTLEKDISNIATSIINSILHPLL